MVGPLHPRPSLKRLWRGHLGGKHCGFVYNAARAEALTGWVRNVGYNTVEAVAEGTDEQIKRFLEMTKRGPSISRVDESREEWEQVTGEFDVFGVKASR